jgi:hypothetical protein
MTYHGGQVTLNLVHGKRSRAAIRILEDAQSTSTRTMKLPPFGGHRLSKETKLKGELQ